MVNSRMIIDDRLLNKLEYLKKRQLNSFFFDNELDVTYSHLYDSFPEFLRPYFSSIHCLAVSGLEDLQNGVVKDSKAYLHAEYSRRLIAAIDASKAMENILKDTEYVFMVYNDYKEAFEFVRPFLHSTGGSYVNIDSCWKDLELYYYTPIFTRANIIEIKHENKKLFASKQVVGSGSYATVSKFKDDYYDAWFAVKELKSNADDKDLERFKNEYRILKGINSPYVVRVYNFFEDSRSYIMEAMDGTIEELCQRADLTLDKRRNLVLQIIRGVKVLHDKGLSHRDIHPCNILYKIYDDCYLVKISDFGLVKDPTNKMTSDGSEVKGRYVDPEVLKIGFSKFEMKHDLYPLAMTIVFVLLGRSSGYEEYTKLAELVNRSLSHSFENINRFEAFYRNEVVPTLKGNNLND